MNYTQSAHIVQVLRWITRLYSALVVAGLLFLIISGLISGPDPDAHDLHTPTIWENIALCLMVIQLLGLALAWRRELTGSLITLVAFIASVMILPNSKILWYLTLMPALLFLACWWLSRRQPYLKTMKEAWQGKHLS